MTADSVLAALRSFFRSGACPSLQIQNDLNGQSCLSSDLDFIEHGVIHQRNLAQDAMRW